MTHETFMARAMDLARLAANEGEAPVGCVVVREGVIVGRGRNNREASQNALGHAELNAISEACQAIGFWRLPDCDIYVTLEPCPMCAGAIINSRLARLFYGAKDPKAWACGSVIDLFSYPFNHKPTVSGGLLEKESSELLTGFFRSLRSK